MKSKPIPKPAFSYGNQLPRPIIPYLGSKFRIAQKVIAHFPAHEIYVEPFGGAGNILLNKEHTRHDVYNDLSSDMVNLFEILRNQSSELIRKLKRTAYCEADYLQSFEPCDCPVERARRLILRAHASFHSTDAFTSRPFFKMHAGLDTPALARQFANFTRYLPMYTSRLRNVTISCKPALWVINKYNDPRVLIYCDPPYISNTRKSSAKYLFEMDNDAHLELIDVLLATKSAVAISGYANPAYDKAFKKWQRFVIPTLTFNISATITRTEEVLWVKAAVK